MHYADIVYEEITFEFDGPIAWSSLGGSMRPQIMRPLVTSVWGSAPAGQRAYPTSGDGSGSVDPLPSSLGLSSPG